MYEILCTKNQNVKKFFFIPKSIKNVSLTPLNMLKSFNRKCTLRRRTCNRKSHINVYSTFYWSIQRNVSWQSYLLVPAKEIII